MRFYDCHENENNNGNTAYIKTTWTDIDVKIDTNMQNKTCLGKVISVK